MPGIHVRTFSNCGWVEREREPTLTVPGSYWLCCKQNIYKFTFKHHKTSKSSQDFSHARELMKVVRKIIKLHPRQGQQFCTRHLLVTYNHASWTRQDKMFAMLKFRDHPEAIAYPHAFILTIKKTSTDSHFKSPAPRSPGGTDTSTDSSTSAHQIVPPPKRLKSASFFGDLSLPLVEKYLHEQKDTPGPEDDHQVMNDVQETVDMPYQYLIEREIEKTKAKIETKISGSRRYLEEAHHQSNEVTSSRGRITPGSSPSDSTPRLDITDLVMEGLMFTIRQDKDSVTVVEQKTKLEPDEVLENSEKVEGRTGECLVNSSLLKLENLVGKIEIAERKERLPFFLDPGPPGDLPGEEPEGREILVRSTSPRDILKDERPGEKAPQGQKTRKKMRKREIRSHSAESALKGSRITSSSSSSSSSGSEGAREKYLEASPKGEHLADPGDEKIEEEDIIPEVLQTDNPVGDFQIRQKVTSPLMDDGNFERSPGSPGSPRSRPKVLSSEIVQYDLSLLRSARTRKNLFAEVASTGQPEDVESLGDGELSSQASDTTKSQRILPENNDVRVNLLKFVDDMTLGVRVVVQRLDITSLSRFGGNTCSGEVV
ncbi:uncharacterized protein [Fopius arisanus]|uniref:Uncharacterized protein n=2 Tax=Fopius arisanus TaxID=64838 RepID=A0A9R1U363_9HYME|nr:PREDICTED: uncharacterized protein LOC105268643 [Fopius arisanus]